MKNKVCELYVLAHASGEHDIFNVLPSSARTVFGKVCNKYHRKHDVLTVTVYEEIGSFDIVVIMTVYDGLTVYKASYVYHADTNEIEYRRVEGVL